MTMGIYKITNKINNKVYIGKSIDIENRWKQHKRELNDISHCNKRLQRDWILHGEENYDFEIIKIVDNETQLPKYEQKYINEYKSLDEEFGYNIAIANSENKPPQSKTKVLTVDELVDKFNYKNKRKHMNLNDDIIKIYQNNINEYIKTTKIKSKLNLFFLFSLIPFVYNELNILCNNDGECLNQRSLIEELKIDRKTVYNNLQILMEHNFIKEIKDTKNNYYVINPKYIHKGFYIYEEIEELFKK